MYNLDLMLFILYTKNMQILDYIKHFNHCSVPDNELVQESLVFTVEGKYRKRAKCLSCGLVSVEPMEVK